LPVFADDAIRSTSPPRPAYADSTSDSLGDPGACARGSGEQRRGKERKATLFLWKSIDHLCGDTAFLIVGKLLNLILSLKLQAKVKGPSLLG